LAHQFGRIEKGYAADFVLLDTVLMVVIDMLISNQPIN
jgi:N-acetylglucosamine-6-phosphate deacetylase